MKKKRLGEILVQRGSLSQETLNRAIAIQEGELSRLGEILLQRGLVSKLEIGAAMEEVLGIPFANCPPASIDSKVLTAVPHSVAVRCCALPLEIRGKELVIAMAEPQNLGLIEDLRFSCGLKPSVRFSFRGDILEGIRKFYHLHGVAETSAEPEPGEEVDLGDSDNSEDPEFITADTRKENRAAIKELQASMQRTPAVRFVSNMLALAVQKGASDIHIEPRVGDAIVRVRVDGILGILLTIPAEHQAAVVSRIKILADMDIAERRVPQDGRFLMQYRGNRLDLRVSTLPTLFGEKVVLRILDPRASLITLDNLGLSAAHIEELHHILTMPQGMLLVTGPTGSGKSTTLYAALNLLHDTRRNIVTVEDPVEYMLDGINQVQVRPKAGLTFASCLPSILRQDPDIVMIGEIRDGATAEIALKASQTGHLVLSTLHTNDSISAVTRLLDLGIPSYLIASSVTAVLAQRLVRRLCSCRSQIDVSMRPRRLPAESDATEPDLSYRYEPRGCDRCEHTGYKGRIGIYEILVVDDVREAVRYGARAEEITSNARDLGFRTIHEDAMDKIKEGLTTLEEVRRVVPSNNKRTDRVRMQRSGALSVRREVRNLIPESVDSDFLDLPSEAVRTSD